MPYFDEFAGKVMTEQMSRPFDLLLGRTTYEIFAAYWLNHDDAADPVASGLNKATKYVVSDAPMELSWKGSVLISGDVVGAIKALKRQEGPQLQVHGSGKLIQTLLRQDLVDQLWLKAFRSPWGGKRPFAEGTMPAASGSPGRRCRRAASTTATMNGPARWTGTF